jgi:hypothetical protein
MSHACKIVACHAMTTHGRMETEHCEMLTSSNAVIEKEKSKLRKNLLTALYIILLGGGGGGAG